MERLFSLLGTVSFPLKMMILVGVSAFPFRNKGERSWLAKLAGCAALMMAVSFVEWGGGMAVSIARYAVVFVLCAAMLLVCFHFSFKEALFCAASGYAMEHISACVSICWQAAAGLYGKPLGAGERVLSDAIITVTLIALFFIFTRRFQEQRAFAPQGRGAETLVIMVLVVALVISIWQFTLGYTLTGERDLVAFVTALLRMIACILLLIIQSNLLNNTRLQEDNAVLQNMLAQEEKRYAASRESAELLNIKYHDMKHILSSLETLEHKGREIDQLVVQVRSAVDDYALVRDTGNTPLNTVLFEKALTCRRHRIRLTYMGNGALLSFVSAIDIYALVGNIVDNAIESVKQEEEEKRYIDLRVTARGPFIKLSCENFCSREVPMVNSVPVSTKKDRYNHGFGTKSILYIAQKYHGETIFKQVETAFKVSVIFCGVTLEANGANPAAGI